MIVFKEYESGHNGVSCTSTNDTERQFGRGMLEDRAEDGNQKFSELGGK